MNKENETIIRTLNKYGRIPEVYELLNIIEELEQKNKQLKEELEKEKQKNSKAIDMLESQYISGVYYANYDTTNDNLYQPVTIKDRLAIEILKGTNYQEKLDGSK